MDDYEMKEEVEGDAYESPTRRPRHDESTSSGINDPIPMSTDAVRASFSAYAAVTMKSSPPIL